MTFKLNKSSLSACVRYLEHLVTPIQPNFYTFPRKETFTASGREVLREILSSSEWVLYYFKGAEEFYSHFEDGKVFKTPKEVKFFDAIFENTKKLLEALHMDITSETISEGLSEIFLLYNFLHERYPTVLAERKLDFGFHATIPFCQRVYQPSVKLFEKMRFTCHRRGISLSIVDPSNNNTLVLNVEPNFFLFGNLQEEIRVMQTLHEWLTPLGKDGKILCGELFGQVATIRSLIFEEADKTDLLDDMPSLHVTKLKGLSKEVFLKLLEKMENTSTSPAFPGNDSVLVNPFEGKGVIEIKSMEDLKKLPVELQDILSGPILEQLKKMQKAQEGENPLD